MKYKFILILISLSIILPGAVLAVGTVTLSWSANNEPDLAGYRIYYGTSPRTGDCPPAGYPNKIDLGKTATPEKPNYKIENLEEGKTYYFSVTSYDASGNESCFSQEMSKIIPKAKISWYHEINRLFQKAFSPLTLFFQKIF